MDTVPPLDLSSDPTALLRAAATSLGGTFAAGGADPAPHHTGSAVYSLASLLNHSCEPNLEVGFPANNARLALTAARDIARGEQLTISYIDATASAPVRQEALQWGYGFACGCPRCREGS